MDCKPVIDALDFALNSALVLGYSSFAGCLLYHFLVALPYGRRQRAAETQQ